MNDQHTLSVKVPRDMADKIRRLAESKGLNVSNYLRLKIYEEVKNNFKDIR